MNESLLVQISVSELLLRVKEVVREEIQGLNPAKEIESDELLTINQVCQLTGTCKATIHNWKRQGILSFYRLGRKVRFKKNEVLSAMKKIERRELR